MLEIAADDGIELFEVGRLFAKEHDSPILITVL
ncbi:selenophosphate synthetase [Pasteurella multocida subsp. multocida str. Anand1_cattle]|nr:selenophosphate synthetase [Pasteurella multocida subsp. multocida str. Anand1_cattle]